MREAGRVVICTCVPVSTETRRVEHQTVVGCPTWLLGTKFRSSEER